MKEMDVSQDIVLAYIWFSLAAAQGIEPAGRSRDMVAGRTTASQIVEAQRLEREWLEKHQQ